jgi:nanoRNase/pAp phosphatase (c-di-AMP/oligoRNAs hydrolase)
MTNIIAPSSQNPITTDHLVQLRAAADPGPVLILTHDNPDPDGMTAGASLSILLEAA